MKFSAFQEALPIKEFPSGSAGPQSRIWKLLVRLLSFALVFLPGWSGSPHALELNRPVPQAVKSVASAVWKLTDGRYTGTATAISGNRFITKAHVIFDAPGAGDLTLSQKGNPRRLKVRRVLALSLAYDLALLEIKGRVDDHVSFEDALSEGRKGPLYGIGYPGGSFMYLRPLSDRVYEDDYFYAFAANRSPLGGASGGPILNVEGQVVAINGIGSDNILHGLKAKRIVSFLLDRFLFEKPQAPGVACSHLGFRACLEAGVERMKVLSEKNPLAQYAYGRGFYTNKGKKRIDFLLKSARQGLSMAKRGLGRYYSQKGRNLEKKGELEGAGLNYRKAARWFLQAWKDGDPVSSGYLGDMMHRSKKGIVEIPRRASELTDDSVKFGFLPAIIVKAARLYNNNENSMRKRRQALELMQKAAQIGNEYAKNFMKKVSSK